MVIPVFAYEQALEEKRHFEARVSALEAFISYWLGAPSKKLTAHFPEGYMPCPCRFCRDARLLLGIATGPRNTDDAPPAG